MDTSERGSAPLSTQTLFSSQLSPSADLAVGVILILTCIASLLGNGMVLLVHCRKRKKLRPPELMTINLAFCDFGFMVLGAPFFIISSLSHGWVFGETGCIWYGIQGFVFGIGSLHTTCLISLDRCLKICCLRYVAGAASCLSLDCSGLDLDHTVGGPSSSRFWKLRTRTIRWLIKSSQSDRIYILLILGLCFGIPTLTIIASYLSILLTVSRSNRTLSSIPSTTVSHANKDLRLAKMAAVVCSSFLLAWLPYAVVSLMSALMPNPSKSVHDSSVDRADGSRSRSPQQFSSLPPLVTLIPAMLAKSHCMMNPLIYQIMNKEFRDDVYLMVFGPDMAEKRRLQSHRRSSSDRSTDPSPGHSLRTKRSIAESSFADRLSSKKDKKRASSESFTFSVETISVESESVDTQRNMEQQREQKSFKKDSSFSSGAQCQKHS
ncbi:opsin 9 isoform X3 [Synchiropus splendidus]|uniref:opsin 9 isoform X3 n=1 Tax=Synchiropus splendidus TaxID=270530 RepID=UPI00237E8E95|nr:opsin 9 isoform X3 [Synchiropus splendidus]